MLVHGLMGRGTTWTRQLPWLTRLGTVYSYDAPWHRGRDVDDPHPISTERFVADLGDAVGELGARVRIVGHSMGALHAWCLAAQPPNWFPRWCSRTWLQTSAAAPPARGNLWLHALPVEFDSAEQVFAEFARRRAVFPGGVRPHRNRVAAARSHLTMDRDRRGVGYPRLLGAMAGGARPVAAHRGRQLGHAAGPDAADVRKRPCHNVFACSASGSPDPRRSARPIPRSGAGFPGRMHPRA